MFKNSFYFIIIIIYSTLGLSQNLCANLFAVSGDTKLTPRQVVVRVGQLKRLAREIRSKKEPVENIAVSNVLLRETIDYSLSHLREALATAPAMAEIIVVKSPVGLFGMNKKVSIPREADQVLLKSLITEFETLRSADQVNYLKYLNLSYISIWALTKTPPINEAHYFRIVKELFTITNGKLSWTIDSTGVISGVKKMFEADRYNVPIILKESLEAEAFLSLWIYGIRPLGLNYAPVISYDTGSGNPLAYLLHDERHFAFSQQRLGIPITIDGKVGERIIFLKLLRKMRADNLSEREIFMIKYAILSHIHDNDGHLAGLQRTVKDPQAIYRRDEINKMIELEAGMTRVEFLHASNYFFSFLANLKN